MLDNEKFKKYVLPIIIIIAAAAVIYAVMANTRGKRREPVNDIPPERYSSAVDKDGSSYYYALDPDGNEVRIESDGNGSDYYVYTDESGNVVSKKPVETDKNGSVIKPEAVTAGIDDHDPAAPVIRDGTDWNSDWNERFDDNDRIPYSGQQVDPDQPGMSPGQDTNFDGLMSSSPAPDVPEVPAESGNATDTQQTGTDNEWGTDYYPGWY